MLEKITLESLIEEDMDEDQIMQLEMEIDENLSAVEAQLEQADLILSLIEKVDPTKIATESAEDPQIQLERAGAGFLSDSFTDMAYVYGQILSFFKGNTMRQLDNYFKANKSRLTAAWDPSKQVSIRRYSITMDELVSNMEKFLANIEKFIADSRLDMKPAFIDIAKDFQNLSGATNARVASSLGVKGSLDFGILVGKAGSSEYSWKPDSEKKVKPQKIVRQLKGELFPGGKFKGPISQVASSAKVLTDAGGGVSAKLQKISVDLNRTCTMFGRSNLSQVTASISSSLSKIMPGVANLAVTAQNIAYIYSRFALNQMHVVVSAMRLNFRLIRIIRADVKSLYKQLGVH